MKNITFTNPVRTALPVANTTKVRSWTKEEAIREIRTAFSSRPSGKIITLMVWGDFLITNRMAINFLTSGQTGIVALKGIPGVFSEFFFDGHPKAIGINRAILASVGIILPQEGILDPAKWTEEGRDKFLAGHKEQIQRLKTCLGLPVADINELETKKFSVLQEGKKVSLGENEVIYANAHIYDLVVIDEQGNEIVVPTFKSSPIISDQCKILGVGPETIRMWGKVISASSSVIIVGKTAEDILPMFPPVGEGPHIISFPETTPEVLSILNNPRTWQ